MYLLHVDLTEAAFTRWALAGDAVVAVVLTSKIHLVLLVVSLPQVFGRHVQVKHEIHEEVPGVDEFLSRLLVVDVL